MLIKIRPLYKVRMHQHQSQTGAHDTYGTITQQSDTQQLSFNTQWIHFLAW